MLHFCKVDILCVCSVIQLCLSLCDPMDVACLAPLSMGLSRQEYWSGLPFSSPEKLPDPGVGPVSLVSPPLSALIHTWKKKLKVVKELVQSHIE